MRGVFERPPDVKEETAESAGKFVEEMEKFIVDKTPESAEYISNRLDETKEIEGPEKLEDLSVERDTKDVATESVEKHSDRLKSNNGKHTRFLNHKMSINRTMSSRVLKVSQNPVEGHWVHLVQSRKIPTD